MRLFHVDGSVGSGLIVPPRKNCPRLFEILPSMSTHVTAPISAAEIAPVVESTLFHAGLTTK